MSGYSGPRIPPSDAAIMADQYVNKLWSLTRLERHWGWSRVTIKRALLVRGVTLRPRGGANNAKHLVSKQDQIAMAAQYCSTDISIKELGKQWGVPLTTTRCILLRQGVTLRPIGANSRWLNRRAA